ncbi:MAG TPA: isochorismate synthase [candidate division Zixibacteria bacterium]|nr:isochorismate synthase [candidate division Zixibacteria bacterium]MDD4917353.1 isochorismate synthase [candidate division Zixibacteria bacterium]MDM7971911.1 isochorismate synthase [candidate division Zixibacteria bacterium]HOD66255.1 isochorismate synthase [candidate division Zixibacteria bacterium]HOZ06956.1 isochorismate synthase [candidate division Zixibacteria bacterium]
MMPSVFKDSDTHTPAGAAAHLAEEIARRAAHPRAGSPHVERCEVPLAAMEPAAWLAAQRQSERIFWSDREDRSAVAGVGAAAVEFRAVCADPHDLMGRIRELIGDAEGVRCYGGIRFDSDREQADHWRQFGGARFVLPRFELAARGGAAVLAVNLRFPEDRGQVSRIIEDLAQLRFAPADPGIPPAGVRRRVDTPGREDWLDIVGAAVDEINAGRMDKIVLARESRCELGSPADPFRLTARLAASAPGCFVFAFKPPDGAAFLGATPERLYRREGRRITSEALAGTRRRGETPAEDALLGEKLLTSRKEAQEHACVADAVRGALAALCREAAEEKGRELVKLARVQHLATRFAGVLRDGVGDADILARLHPTPAVGGAPTATARQRIRELEAFDRGWYAGPVGWIGADSAEFAVAIRSALAAGDTLRLYSGAGIVGGSHPDREWDEIENKIDNYLKLLAGP